MTVSFGTAEHEGSVDIRLYALGVFVPGGYIATGLPADQLSFTWVVDDFGFTGPDNVYRVVVSTRTTPLLRAQQHLHDPVGARRPASRLRGPRLPAAGRLRTAIAPGRQRHDLGG